MKVLWISDGVRPTGFSRVAHGILDNLGSDYDVDWIAVNYYGDPHEYPYKIYPAYVPNTPDVYGFQKIKRFANNEYDLIFILNDVWIIDLYLKEIKENFKTIPPIVIYTPVDSINHYPDWYKNFDIVSKVVAYNEHGRKVIESASGIENIGIIPHGVDTFKFYRLDESRQEIRAGLTDREDFINAKMVILNGNRNNPRKQIWNSMIAFSLFAKDKKDVFFLYHGGYIDADINVIQLSKALDIEDKLILTNTRRGPGNLPDSELNKIYNCAEVGVNTSTGEGWGLVNIEHAVAGGLQIVPNHSSFSELFEDCGILVDPTSYHVNPDITTIGMTVNPYHVAQAYQTVYDNPSLIDEYSKKAYDKFSSSEYSWITIGRKWDELFREVVNGNNLSKQHKTDN